MIRPPRGVTIAVLLAMTTAAAAARAAATTQPAVDATYAGSWRGDATAADGTTTGVVLTLVEIDDDGGYDGVVSGFGPGREAPLTRVSDTDGTLIAEAEVDTALGPLVVRYELALGPAGDVLTGTQRFVFGTQQAAFDVELRKRRRPDVPQPQVEPRIDYFVGTWAFDYLGGEFPPLSAGTRSGEVTFTRRGGAPWVDGVVTGEVYGDPYTEQVVIGFDTEHRFLAVEETLANGVELLSVASWQSPIAISFVTSPVEADGQRFQLRRVIAVTSETAFRVTEEFSVDGGPFRRLGNADYRRIVAGSGAP